MQAKPFRVWEGEQVRCSEVVSISSVINESKKMCVLLTHLFSSTVTGGMLLVGKGIGQGVTQGDGRALVSGISKGVQSVGNGVGQGVGSAVTGAADGVLSVGKGLFSGVKTVGKGIGGAFTGKREDSSRKHGR